MPAAIQCGAAVQPGECETYVYVRGSVCLCLPRPATHCSPPNCRVSSPAAPCGAKRHCGASRAAGGPVQLALGHGACMHGLLLVQALLQIPPRQHYQPGMKWAAAALDWFLGPVCTQVCDLWDSFGTHEANVVCRQLGLPLPGRSVGGSYWGSGNGPTVLDWQPGEGLGCRGNETTLAEVRHRFALIRHPPACINAQRCPRAYALPAAVMPCQHPLCSPLQCRHGGWGKFNAACNSKSQVGVECGAQPRELGYCQGWAGSRVCRARVCSRPTAALNCKPCGGAAVHVLSSSGHCSGQLSVTTAPPSRTYPLVQCKSS